ncbi:hypothetical protein [Synechococcus sp. BIOS-U3-1]|uniref:hypothetical protein n=1 Tax=Synechococcus sp. BIOS-U3-1 TaxID=1400865 RepID=UPI001646A90E|nr:hypothetical protein [Synechococcus sp. BIOS-U3-1]
MSDDSDLMSPAEFFDACLLELCLDEIFADADRWAFHIQRNIVDIAVLHNKENSYVLTGDEPVWMLELFRKNKVSIEGEVSPNQ